MSQLEKTIAFLERQANLTGKLDPYKINKIFPPKPKDETPEEAILNAGQQMADLIETRAKIPTYRHTITCFYSPDCRHCKNVLAQLEQYAKAHPQILLIKIDATSQDMTNYLQAITKDNVAVPTVLVDDTFIIQAQTNFLTRLTYAMQLAESQYQTGEERQRLILSGASHGVLGGF